MSYVEDRSHQLELDAELAFKHHEIVQSGEDRWLLRRKRGDKWSSMYSVEVVSLFHGGLYVGGDIEGVVFAYHSGNALDKIAWMGSCEKTDGYVLEKATNGAGNYLAHREYDVNAAKEYLEDLMVSYEHREDVREEIKDVIEYVPADEWEFHSALANLSAECSIHVESTEGGLVTSPALYYAHGAVKRLYKILEL